MIEGFFEDGNKDFNENSLKTFEEVFYNPDSPLAGNVAVHNLMCDMVRNETEFNEVYPIEESFEEEGPTQ